MSIFIKINTEPVVQVSDKTRIDVSRSFVSKDNPLVQTVKIKPSEAGSYVDVTGNSTDDWYLDWVYTTAETVTVSVQIYDGTTTTTGTITISVVTVATDNLFSSDSDLLSQEPDIMDLLPKSRNSFLDVHRAAQTKILQWLDHQGYTDDENEKLTKDAVVDITEMKEWSTYLALRLIFEANSNDVDDIFRKKSEYYEVMELKAKNRAFLRLDYDGDGTIDDAEEAVRISSPRLVRQ